MTVVSKKLYINQLDKIVNKYSNTYQRTIKIKPTDAKPNTYSECGVEHNEKNRNFKIGDHVRIEKYKNISAKSHSPN